VFLARVEVIADELSSYPAKGRGLKKFQALRVDPGFLRKLWREE
jgi:hypothetical protein